MKYDRFLAICVVAAESASQSLVEIATAQVSVLINTKSLLIDFFFCLFGLFLRFPPFGGLTLFVSPWLPTIFDPVALFATISAFPFHGAESFRPFVPFGSFKCHAP